ncbi:MAG: hypothetical protein Q8P59_06205 [Dehalococcoidia bacterium]|nr:hypothetical protein [Dehalococcoidia bacterium]
MERFKGLQRVAAHETAIEGLGFRLRFLPQISGQEGHQQGTLRETTTEVLNQFKAAGLIELHRMHINLIDADGLNGVAEG